MARISGGSWQGGCYLYVDYSVVGQSVAGNYSDVNYTFGIHFGDYYFNSTNRHVNWDAGPGSGFDNWDSAPSLPWPHGGTHRDYGYHSGSVRIYHDWGGNALAKVFGKMNPSSAGGGGTRQVYGEFWLPQIARYSSEPSTPSISDITSTSVHVTFSDGSGGAPIDSREIHYGTDPSSGQYSVSSNGSTTITNLFPGTMWYFWARTHNSAGYSGWSGRASAFTPRTPDAPSSVYLSEINQTSMKAEFTGNYDGGSPALEWQLGYGTDPSTAQFYLTWWGPLTVIGLAPGTTYYFWARGRNSVGWSPWSAVSGARTIAGAYVKVGTIWKEAIPYVNDNGVWKLARPWAKTAGIWKETF